MLNTRVEKNVTLGVREFWAKWSRIKQKKKKFLDSSSSFGQEQNGFVKFRKFVPVFAQEKEFVIKLLKFLKCMTCSVQATAFME